MKKKKCRTGGSLQLGGQMQVASSLASLLSSYVSASNYQGNAGASTDISFEAGLQNGLIGLIPDLIKRQKDMKAKAAFVSSASPGNYYQGGPISPPLSREELRRDTRRSRPARVIGEPNYQQWVPPPAPDLNSALSLGLPPQLIPLVKVDTANTEPGTKSKSKDRFREMNTGGPIDPASVKSFDKEKLKAVQLDLKNRGLYSVIEPQLQRYATNNYRTKIDIEQPDPSRLNAGGKLDNQLSSTSFQVKDNPNVTDGKYYPQYNANLDHEEVVKNKFVFSNTLKNPMTNKSFAKEALPIEKSTGNAEKRLKLSPNDPINRTTINVNSNRVEALAKLQEALATAKGLRQPTRNFKDGGPTDPLPGQPYMYLGNDYYYDPYQNRYLSRNPFTGGYSVEKQTPGAYGIRDKKRVDFFSLNDGKITTNLPLPLGARDVRTLDVNAHLQKYPSTMSIQDPLFPYSMEAYGNVPPADSPVNNVPVNNIPLGSPKAAKRNTPSVDYRGAQAEYEARQPSFNSDQLSYERSKLNPFDTLPIYRQVGPAEQPRVESMNRSLPTPNGIDPTATETPKDNSASGASAPFAIGDALQALDVASKFAMLRKGYETEKLNPDTTPITQQTYDPSNALNKTQRNYQQSLNSLSGASINQLRSFQGNLYAKKLAQDSDILSSYNQMNQNARTAYEQRLADQRRFNVGQINYTNDVNARNRGQYYTAVDRAFSSLGNFGQGLNDKRKAADVMNILRVSYPDVYAKIIGNA